MTKKLLLTLALIAFPAIALANYGQGWMYAIPGSNFLNSSTSPTVAYITATSSAVSNFTGNITSGGSIGAPYILGSTLVSSQGNVNASNSGGKFCFSIGGILCSWPVITTSYIYYPQNNNVMADNSGDIEVIGSLNLPYPIRSTFLAADNSGNVIATTAPSGGGSSFGYPFPGNATSTNLTFSSGITVSPSNGLGFTGESNTSITTPADGVIYFNTGTPSVNLTLGNTTNQFNRFTILNNGSQLKGQVQDNSGSGGTNGYVLQTNGSVASWVSTSSLNFASSSGPLNVLQASNGSGGYIATGTPALTAGYFIATTTTASQLAYASTTALTTNGFAYLSATNGRTIVGGTTLDESDADLTVKDNTGQGYARLTINGTSGAYFDYLINGTVKYQTGEDSNAGSNSWFLYSNANSAYALQVDQGASQVWLWHGALKVGNSALTSCNSGSLLGTDSNNVIGCYAESGSGSVTNTATTSYASGTAYTLTNSSAALTFGTTNPVIKIDTAGTYLIEGRVMLDEPSCIGDDLTVTLKLRRTNNTAADVANSSTSWNSYGGTLGTVCEAQSVSIPPVIYTTSNTNDSITIYGVNNEGGSDTVKATEASIVAVRLY